MLPLTSCPPTRRLVPALAFLLAGFLSLTTISAAGSSPATTSLPDFDPRSNIWRIDLGNGSSASPAAGSQTGCEWSFTPNTSPHPEISGEHIWPHIAIAPDGMTALGWMDAHFDGTSNIFYSTSTDRGATWSAPEWVDRRTTGEASRFIRLGFTPSGIPVAVWEDDRAGAFSVYISKRDPDNGGNPWTPPIQINTIGSPPFDYAMHPSLAIFDNHHFYVAWTDWREGPFHQVYMRSSTDGGDTWGKETRISDGLGYEPVAADPCLIIDRSPRLTADTVILNCITNDWRGDEPGGRYPNVYFYRSMDGGANWTIGVQVNNIEPFYQQAAQHSLVQLEDGTLTAAWFHFTGNPAQFHSSTSTDLGLTWSPSVSAHPSGISSGVSIHAFADRIFAAFSIREGDLNACFRLSFDGGRTWPGPACRMDDAPSGDANGPIVVPVSPNEVQGAWWDNRPGLAAWKIFTSRGSSGTAGIPSPGVASHGPHRGGLIGVPNPSSCAAPVRISLSGAAGSERGDAGLRYGVYDVAGRLLRILERDAGGIVWNGTDSSGRLMPPGVYWVRIESGRPGPEGNAARLVRLR
jgi:BNR repeat-like domain